MKYNQIVTNELLDIIKSNNKCIIQNTSNHNKTYQIMNEDFCLNNEAKLQFNGSIIVKNFEFDFLNENYSISNNVSFDIEGRLQLELLNNLLKKGILPLEQIKKISFDEAHRPYRNWGEIKQLFLYNKEDISIILEKYKGSMSNYVVDEVLNRIISSDNSIKNLTYFTENQIDKFKSNQINFIHDYFIKNANEKEYEHFQNILKENGKIPKESSIFEEKENKFEYLNLNVELFMKKFFFTKPGERLSKLDDYEKIAKDTIAFLKTHKKKLGFENIYFENRSTTKNEFLISIETKNNIDKQMIQKVFLEYVQLYVNEINKIEDKTAAGIYSAHKSLKDNKETISNFIFLNLGLEESQIKKKHNKSKL